MCFVSVPNVLITVDFIVSLQAKWINRERVLVFATRGISFQHRHLMKDIIKMLPHAKAANKMERKENLFVVNEVHLI
jgi:ribosome biogenesis protein BRX1